MVPTLLRTTNSIRFVQSTDCVYFHSELTSKRALTSVSHSIAPIFHIDGFGTVTGINDINIDNDSDSQKGDVYTASGILVRKDATNLEGLPAGVYLKNGKKYIVK